MNRSGTWPSVCLQHSAAFYGVFIFGPISVMLLAKIIVEITPLSNMINQLTASVAPTEPAVPVAFAAVPAAVAVPALPAILGAKSTHS